jgi:hypothetical protein
MKEAKELKNQMFKTYLFLLIAAVLWDSSLFLLVFHGCNGHIDFNSYFINVIVFVNNIFSVSVFILLMFFS